MSNRKNIKAAFHTHNYLSVYSNAVFIFWGYTNLKRFYPYICFKLYKPHMKKTE